MQLVWQDGEDDSSRASVLVHFLTPHRRPMIATGERRSVPEGWLRPVISVDEEKRNVQAYSRSSRVSQRTPSVVALRTELNWASNQTLMAPRSTRLGLVRIHVRPGIRGSGVQRVAPFLFRNLKHCSQAETEISVHT